MPGGAWAITSPCARLRRTPLLRRCWLVLSRPIHRAPPNIREARLSGNSAATRMARWIAWVGSARQRLDIDSTRISGRGRATTRRRERARPWPLPLPALPAIQRRGHTFVDSASGRICSFCQHQERTTCGGCPAASGARARAQRCNSGLTALRATELPISCREARWCQCSASCVARTVVAWCENRYWATALVLRRLGDWWLCATCCWFSCLVPSALHDLTVLLGEDVCALSGPRCTRGPIVAFSA